MTAAPPIRVMIAEDDYLVREGARALLSAQPDIEVVGLAESPTELLAQLGARVPDAVLLDIRMPPTFTTEGIDLARQLRTQHPGIGVVILSQHADPEYALELLGEGSRSTAYLLKERLGDVDQLLHAIREVVVGGSVLDPEIVDAMLKAQRARPSTALELLTDRETEVLAEMASGKRNAAIARSLHITERSVEKHANAIFTKLGLTDANDLNRRVAAVLVFLQRS